MLALMAIVVKCPGAFAGTPDAPRCGFSRKVAAAVQATGHPFGFFDILTDDAVRQACTPAGMRTPAP